MAPAVMHRARMPADVDAFFAAVEPVPGGGVGRERPGNGDVAVRRPRIVLERKHPPPVPGGSSTARNADRAGSLAFGRSLGHELQKRGLHYTPHYTQQRTMP